MNTKKLVTIAIPVYNEAKNLPEVFRRVNEVLGTMSAWDFEIIQIDNGSTDGSAVICKEHANRDSRWKFVSFSRNFGIEASFYAGALLSRGDALLYLFSDLQDPPEKIPEMLQKWSDGYDVVYGLLTNRQDHNIYKSFGAKLAYKVIFSISEITIPANATDFRLISRNVIDVIVRCHEKVRYMRGLTHWAGFKQTHFEFSRSPRLHGESKAGFWWCVKYAIAAMTSFSAKPLRWASATGICLTGLSILGTFVYVVHLLLTRLYGFTYITPPPPGWTTLVLLSLFLVVFNVCSWGLLASTWRKSKLKRSHGLYSSSPTAWEFRADKL